jgi:hypothetical protein
LALMSLSLGSPVQKTMTCFSAAGNNTVDQLREAGQKCATSLKLTKDDRPKSKDELNSDSFDDKVMS